MSHEWPADVTLGRFTSFAVALALFATLPACQREVPPTQEGAVAVIQSHYKAINEERYQDAYADWESEGKASGKSFLAFLNGYAQMDKVDVTTGTPGPIEGAAGSRSIIVPVEVTAHRQNGGQDRFTGTYTLRYNVVEGAKSKQRRWQLYSSKLDPVERADSLS